MSAVTARTEGEGEAAKRCGALEEKTMPRKGHVPKRDPIADPIYSSTLVTKFVNTMMWGGKKSTAQGIFYKCMEIGRAHV